MSGAAAAASVIGIDVGGTNMSGGLAGPDGKMSACIRRRTERAAGAEAGLRQICGIISDLADVACQAGVQVRRVGIGFGGPVDAARGLVRLSHHVRGWEGFPLRDELQTRFHIPVVLDNDANAGTLGEWRFGAGRGCQDLLYVNVGTGIGAGLVSGGRLLRGASNLAGEIGHIVLMRSGPPCTCGKRGCLEACASGDAIGRRGTEVSGTNLTGREVVALAAAGDEKARSVLDEVIDSLAHGIGTAVSLLNPEIVVIGGGLSEAPHDLFLHPLRDAIPRFALAAATERLRVEVAQLRYDAGVLGAIALALEPA